jgi:hypothetical protein
MTISTQYRVQFSTRKYSHDSHRGIFWLSLAGKIELAIPTLTFRRHLKHAMANAGLGFAFSRQLKLALMSLEHEE